MSKKNNTKIEKPYNLIKGDSLSNKVLSKIEDDSIDVVFTSPPYNMGNSNFYGKWYSERFEQSAKYKNDHSVDMKDNYADWLAEFVKSWLDKTKYIFLNLQSLSSNKRDINKALYLLNDFYCDKIIWNKGSGIPHGKNSRVMTPVFEEIFIFSKNPTKRVGTKEWYGNVKNVITLNGNLANEYSKIHKATFPVELPSYIIEKFVKEGGVIADPFMGTGTTGVAAVKNNIHFIGVELDEEYFKISKKRINNEYATVLKNTKDIREILEKK